VVRLEAAHYRLLTEQLKCQYQDIDDDTLRDTMEGLSDLPQMIEGLVRSALEDEVLLTGLKVRLEAMQERGARIRARHEKKRELAAWAMANVGLTKLEAPDFGVSLCSGAQRVEIFDPGSLPAAFLVPQPPKPDRAAIAQTLKMGGTVDGAKIETGNPFISVRTK
jgi:hypothetical protein